MHTFYGKQSTSVNTCRLHKTLAQQSLVYKTLHYQITDIL